MYKNMGHEVNNANNSNVHWSFWLISGFMLIWNVMGCINFIIQMNPEMISSYGENEQAIIQGRPVWATGAFAMAVFGGALGCLLLERIVSYSEKRNFNKTPLIAYSKNISVESYNHLETWYE